MLTPPAGPRTSGDRIRQIAYIPLEADTRGGDDHFWLIMRTTQRFEEGRVRTNEELLLRCRHCNFGYNSSLPRATVTNLLRMGQEADRHVGQCPHTGRTIDVTSLEVTPPPFIG